MDSNFNNINATLNLNCSRFNFNGPINRLSQLEIQCQKLNLNYQNVKNNNFKKDLVNESNELLYQTNCSLFEAKV